MGLRQVSEPVRSNAGSSTGTAAWTAHRGYASRSCEIPRYGMSHPGAACSCELQASERICGTAGRGEGAAACGRLRGLHGAPARQHGLRWSLHRRHAVLARLGQHAHLGELSPRHDCAIMRIWAHMGNTRDTGNTRTWELSPGQDHANIWIWTSAGNMRTWESCARVMTMQPCGSGQTRATRVMTMQSYRFGQIRATRTPGELCPGHDHATMRIWTNTGNAGTWEG